MLVRVFHVLVVVAKRGALVEMGVDGGAAVTQVEGGAGRAVDGGLFEDLHLRLAVGAGHGGWRGDEHFSAMEKGWLWWIKVIVMVLE